MMALSVRGVMQRLYPYLLSLHDLDDTVALPDPDHGSLTMPTMLRSSHIYMQAHGIYLLGEFGCIYLLSLEV